MNSKLVLVLACMGLPCFAQTAAPPVLASQQAVPVAAPSERGEPVVKHTVTEDDSSRIDELRVRGQLTQVVVTPKVGLTKSYEIIVNRSGREAAEGTGGAGSAIGKRVWNVFAF